MRAWTVDADDIRVAEDFDESLLHRTPEIDAFLTPEREDKFIVIGTKGFGKTLLLKAKRILYQRAAQSTCLPAGNLLDKPIGDKIFSRDAIAFFAASPLPWAKVWLAAVALAALKHTGETDGLKVNARLAALVADRQLHSVIDHFVRLLDLTPSDLQRVAADTDGHLVPRLRTLNASLAIFIDGIDEYFNKHVEETPSHPSVTGELSPEVWYFAQLGLVEVAYQLRRINHRLKVFAAVRKEAYARLPQRTAMVQQYRGSAVDISYSAESLREIFVNNVRRVRTERMALPARERGHPLEAFLGRTSVVDAYTREEEDVFGYVCRHTLLRPRDLMTIGHRLVALNPQERRHEHRMMEAVQQAATEIAHEYLAEIAPYIGALDLDALFRRLPGPVLTREEVQALCWQADVGPGGAEGAEVVEGSARERAFQALFRVGLLGYVQHDIVRGEWRQRFLRPGDATLEPNGVLPPATHYLLHPVLTDVVGRLNPDFLQRIDRLNIVGHDRPWKAPPCGERMASTALLCVLKADVHGFGALMARGVDGPVRKALADAVQRWAPPGAISEAGGGDSVLIVGDDPVALAQTARHLMDDVYAADGQPRLRIALHHGEVRTRERESDLQLAVVGGSAILCAARVEPVVEPGQIWATEAFREQFVQRPSLWRTVPVEAAGGDAEFNVAKTHAGEPPLWVRLHRLES
jgi:class 3 adenylate cyclase